MGMFGALKRKPMFGDIPGVKMGPYDTPPISGGAPQMGQVGAMDANTQGMTKKPGFFAPGQAGRHIVGFIGDALQRIGGGEGTYIPHMMQMQQQDAEIRARLQEAIAKRKAEREDKQWEWENKPQEDKDQLTRYMRAAGIDPMSEQGKQMYSAAAMNAANPLQAVPYSDEQGNTGLQFIRPNAMAPQPSAGVQEGATATNPKTNEKIIFRNGQWQPVGGSVGNGTGGF